jgi:hypothetical protein
MMASGRHHTMFEFPCTQTPVQNPPTRCACEGLDVPAHHSDRTLIAGASERVIADGSIGDLY